MIDSAYRSLPSVDALLQSEEVANLVRNFSHEAVTTVAREVLRKARTVIKDTGSAPVMETMVSEIVKRANRAWGIWPKPVVNATGVVLHTNLGRSPLSIDAAHAAAESASRYSDLEFDLGSGKRGSRNAHISDLLSQTTGAPAGIAVNNNASAVLLTLAAVAGANSEKNENAGDEHDGDTSNQRKRDRTPLDRDRDYRTPRPLRRIHRRMGRIDVVTISDALAKPVQLRNTGSRSPRQ